MNAKGKNLIRITSILFLLAGLASTIVYLIPTLLAGAFTGSTSGEAQIGGMVVTGLFAIYLIWSLFEFIVGIVGLKNANKPEKASSLVTLGIILLVVSIINSVWSAVGQPLTIYTIASMIAGIILPVLFIYGAKQNQRS